MHATIVEYIAYKNGFKVLVILSIQKILTLKRMLCC